MARIDDHVKREVLARTDIATYIGTYVQLRKRGNDLVGLCPFHGEKTPSFHVHPDRNFWKCFGCQKGGDVITFAMEHEALSFPDALRSLARRAGIPIEDEDPAAARVRGEREQIYAANELAASFFHRTLRFAPEAAAARAYAEKRGLTAATIESFKLGFAPKSWDALLRELAQHGVDVELAATAGLLKRSAERGTYYDVYRDRLIIPTYASATGEVVAFGGRALDDSEPKYLNTSTTPVYTKGRGLYALNVARRAAVASDALIVVEGYLDCIALHQAGFANAVASLGTAFTPEQAAELRKYAERIFVCFDADAAGNAATAKSIDVLGAVGCVPFIVQLPSGEDPDTFIRTYGPGAFRTKLDEALEWIQFKLDREIDAIVQNRLPRSQAARRAEVLVRGLPQLEWDRWRVYAANRLGLAADDLRSARFTADRGNFAPRNAVGPVSVRHLAPAAEPPPMEREILAALVDEPALAAEYADRIPAATFEDERYRRIYETLCSLRGTTGDASDVYAALDEDREAAGIVATLQKPDRSSQVRFQDSAARRAHLDRVVEVLTESRLERRKRELDETMARAFAAGAPVPAAERDEYRGLVEDLERRKKRRLAAR
jgi:DNA primase catalytic core